MELMALSHFLAFLGTVIVTAAYVLFFFNDTPTPEISPLPLHAALPISGSSPPAPRRRWPGAPAGPKPADRKSTRLNSSHSQISYAVFCLKKKNTTSRFLYQSLTMASLT